MYMKISNREISYEDVKSVESTEAQFISRFCVTVMYRRVP
jgi:hypothetical protein